MKTVTVTVRRRHVIAGKPEHCRLCPMALTLREAGYPEAFLNPNFWWPNIESKPLPLPENARLFIADIDAGRAVVTPQTFVLPLELEGEGTNTRKDSR